MLAGSVRSHSGALPRATAARSACAIRSELATRERYQWSNLDENELNETNVAEDRAVSLEDPQRQAPGTRVDDRALVAGLSNEDCGTVCDTPIRTPPGEAA